MVQMDNINHEMGKVVIKFNDQIIGLGRGRVSPLMFDISENGISVLINKTINQGLLS